MTIDDGFRSSTQNQGTTGQSQTGQSQTGSSGTARSPEYDDGLTVQDTTHGAGQGVGNDQLQPGTSTMGRGIDAEHGGIGESATGTQGSFTPGSGAAGGSSREPASGTWGRDTTLTGASTGTTGADRDLGDNRDGLGRDRTSDVTADESGTLISADKVIGTAVYDASGERLGTVDSIMLNKRSGKVAYAVMSFGGFLGIGERYHPLPWNVLTYDEQKGGYNVEHSADDLRKAPNYSRDEVDNFDGGSSRSREVDSYYGVDLDRDRVSDQGHSAYRGGAVDADRTSSFGSGATGVEAGDAIGSTTGAGSTGMGSTGMGSNRNY